MAPQRGLGGVAVLITSSFSFVDSGRHELQELPRPVSLTAPTITATHDGESVVFYVSGSTISARRLDTDGAPTGDEVVVSDGLSIASRPTATTLSNGNVVVSWHEGSPPEILARIYDDNLTPIGDIIEIASSERWYMLPDIAATRDGGFTVAYTDHHWDIAMKRFDASGNSAAGTAITGFNLDSRPALATGLDGSTCLVWSRDVLVDGSFENQIWYSIYDADLKVGTPRLLAAGENNGNIEVTSGPHGFIINVTVDSSDDSTSLHAFRLGLDGSLMGSEIIAALEGRNLDPRASVSSDGYTIVAHTNLRNGVGSDVAAGLLSPSGLSVAEDVVLEGGVGGQFDPSVAWISSSTIQLAYSTIVPGSASGGNDFGVAVSRYDIVHTQTGDGRNNAIYGDGLIDVIQSGGGSDDLFGRAGDDTLDGGEGNDNLYGGAGSDRHVGGAGVDYVRYNDADYGNLVIRLDAPGLNTGAAAGDTYSGIEGVVAGAGNDTVVGDVAGNFLHGRGGNDALRGQAGVDKLFGDDGNDHLYGGAGADVHDGGAGFDFARYDDADYGNLVIHLGSLASNTGAAAGDTYVGIEGIAGGVGHDRITGDAGSNRLLGQDGNDTLDGGTGADLLYGGAGNDLFYVDSLNDQARENAGEGTDTVAARASFTLAAGQHIEVLMTSNSAGTSALSLSGNELGQTIRGNAGANRLDGGGGADGLYGYGGADTLVGGTGNDNLFGGIGGDVHDGGDGLDFARYDDANHGKLTIRLDVPSLNTGAAAGDTYVDIEGIVAGAGNDTLAGNAAANILYGRAGSDVLNGLGGSDMLYGEAGADRFVFTAPLGPTNVDRILDFQHGVDDIVLSRTIFGAVGTKLDASEFGADADNFIIYNRGTGQLFYDATGAASGTAPVLFATVTAGTLLDVDDFAVV